MSGMPESKVDVVLRHADGRERVSPELVELELGCDRECRLGEPQSLGGLARDLPDAGGERKHPCRRDGRESPASFSARCEMLAHESVLTAVPEDACEVRLRLGGALACRRRQQCVACDLERAC